MPAARPPAKTGRVVTGVLLLVSGAAAAGTALTPSSHVLRVATLAVVTVTSISSLLGIDALRGRRACRALVTGAALLAAGPILTTVGSDTAAVAVPAAGAALLLWAALAWGRGAAVELAVPAVIAAGITWVNGDSAVPTAMLAVLPTAVLIAEALAWPLDRARRTRATADAALADIDSLLVAALDLRNIDEVAVAADRICRLGSELLRGDGARLYLQGPGRLLLAGRHGTHPAPIDPELGRNVAMDEVLRSGAVRPGATVLVPITGEAGVIGVLSIAGARRPIDTLTSGVAQLFGGQAGAVLDRVGAVESLYDAATRDAVTGVGNRQQAAAIIASLRPGDGLLILEVDDFTSLLLGQGNAAADLLLGQVGLHLRNGTRTGDAVARYGDHQFVVGLRELKAPIDMVVGRLIDSWMAASPSRTMSVGGALHLDAGAPIDTVDRAESALASAQCRGGGRGHVAPDFSLVAVA
ncbi:MAG: diguanylate cyclase [Actinomycetia bacterium]|nr:diguanylate cyclase [Actinomycetes bacterium]